MMEDCEAHLECSGLEQCYLATNELYFYMFMNYCSESCHMMIVN
jgi:hypothetical protein